MAETNGTARAGKAMKALSLWQPWASLIADGRKKVETRSWNMLYRGPLAIHASKRVEKDACEDFGYDWRTIPRGSILCIVEVKRSVQFPDALTPPDPYGDFSYGRYGILMELLEKFSEPVVTRGFQGLWDWDGKR